MPDNTRRFPDLNDRSREVFRRVVEGYLQSGDPVGSRTLARTVSERISAATIRNVMQDLELMGLLDSPHTSAGRVPTQLGLRMFVDSLLEVEQLQGADRARIDATLASPDRDVGAMLTTIGTALSGITQSASVVLTPKQDAPIKHIEFVNLSSDRALVVLVFADNHVENRLFTPPAGHTPSSMREAANFLNAIAHGKTLAELRTHIAGEMAARRQEIDAIAQDLVRSGLAEWENTSDERARLIVRGRANLIAGGGAEAEDVERIRGLFDDLERKREIVEFLELAESGEGVRIFIGSENKLFSLSGSSLVVSPYMNAERKIVGAVGVIGPTRLNYGRIVPIVDYTAQLVGRLLTERQIG
jgi:heat-inducible transcriptional repressor